MIESLRVKISLLDFVYIKDGLIKSIDFKGTDEEEQLYSEIKKAGFSHKVTFYLIVVLIL